MPKALRDFHQAPGGGRAEGVVTIRHAGILARLAGLPGAGDSVPMRLEVKEKEHSEVWIRHFGTAVRRSIQWSRGHLLIESAGPLRVSFRITGDESGMRFQSISARLWGIPVPLRINATERGTESAWTFEVTVRGIGGYRGEMVQVR